MKHISFKIFAILLASVAPILHADSEIAVAIRYLQAEGVSHSQLYLYREDGTLIRQLTHGKSGQVESPVFSPDGKVIVYTRSTDKKEDYWSIEPKGGNPRLLKAPPAWYLTAKDSPYFVIDDPVAPAVKSTPVPEKENPTDEPEHYSTPDGTQEIVLIHNEVDNDADQKDGMHFQLRDIKTGISLELGTLPGFWRLEGLMHIVHSKSVFLIQPPMRVAFFWVHLNSTDGTMVFALDLANPRLVRLSNNWASPVLLPGEPAFLTMTDARYQPIPGAHKTANCSYLEHWDADLKKVRYGTDAPAICYGASTYRSHGKPKAITILNPEDTED